MPEIIIRPDWKISGQVFSQYATALDFLQTWNSQRERWGLKSWESWLHSKVSIMLYAGESKSELERFLHELNLSQIDYEVHW